MLAARHEHRFIATAALPALPSSEAEAYDVADWLHAQRGGELLGWKLGATSAGAQAFLQLQHPFLGRIYADQTQGSPAQLPHYGGELALEAEFGLRLARDLGVDEQPDTLWQAIDAVVPLIEVNRPSFCAPFEVGALALIADNGVNAGAVLGEAITGLSHTSLVAMRIQVSVNGTSVGEGGFAAASNAPMEQLAWAARHLARRGAPLRAGMLIASGACAGTQVMQPGDHLIADFGDGGLLEAYCSLQ